MPKNTERGQDETLIAQVFPTARHHGCVFHLGVFETSYRFTPFSDDARPEIRGKSPPQLAGYDLSRVPMSWLSRGLSLQWPLTLETTDVPNP